MQDTGSRCKTQVVDAKISVSPAMVRAAHLEGTVVARIAYERDGKVNTTEIVSGEKSEAK